MTNFIPIFPLSIVVYPGENLNLHIFEPRYRQLIQECVQQNKPFGVPVVINNKLREWGTLVEVQDVSKTYENGEMDIKTIGLGVFRVLEIINTIPDKLYSGAIVSYHKSEKDNGNRELMQKVVEAVKKLHELLKIKKEFNKPEDALISYDVAHHAGLSQEEEYEILGLKDEVQRQEYLKRHLNKVLPIIAEMEHLKERIKLNGHFKNLPGLKL